MKNTLHYYLAFAISCIGLTQLQATVSVPLYLLQGNSSSNPYRLGVDLLFAGSSTPQRYMLDTGSVALVAGQNMHLGSSTFDTDKAGEISYGGGSDAVKVYQGTGTVSLYDSGKALSVLTVNNANFARAYHSTDARWDLSGGASAAFEGQYAGVLGAGYNYKEIPTNALPGSPVAFSLFSLLAQADLSADTPGFSIRVDKSSKTGTLTLGLTEAHLSTIEYKTAFQAQSGDSLPNIPNTNDVGPRAQYQVKGEGYIGDTKVLGPNGEDHLPVVFDTGGPGTSFEYATQPGPQTVPGGTDIELLMQILNESETFHYDFTSSSETSLNELASLLLTTVSASTASNDPFHLNAGLNPFLDKEIFFVLGDGTSDPYIGFRAIPEPQTILWVSVLGIAALVARRKSRPGAK